jgi:hypothetical protein
VNWTKQLVTGPCVVVKKQLGEPKLPPVVPAVNVNVTVPVGKFAAFVVSTTVAIIFAVQLVPPAAIVQLTALTVVDVASFAMVMVPEVPLLPL